MKLRLLTLAMITLLAASCSKDDVTQNEEANFVTTANTTENPNRTPGFVCDPSWDPRQDRPTLGDNVHTVYYSTNPVFYGLPAGATITAADIDCVRQEFFRNVCGLYMHKDQPVDMYTDIWIQRVSDCPSPFKDDVETATNSDDRVCTGSDCD